MEKQSRIDFNKKKSRKLVQRWIKFFFFWFSTCGETMENLTIHLVYTILGNVVPIFFCFPDSQKVEKQQFLKRGEMMTRMILLCLSNSKEFRETWCLAKFFFILQVFPKEEKPKFLMGNLEKQWSIEWYICVYRIRKYLAKCEVEPFFFRSSGFQEVEKKIFCEKTWRIKWYICDFQIQENSEKRGIGSNYLLWFSKSW